MSEPQESVLLAGASAEKAMQAPDTDLGVENPEKAFADIIGTKPIYLEAHRLMEVVPASHLIQNLAKPYINLNHHVLGPKGVKDIVSAVVSNTTITQLEFEDSCILVEGAICIGEMLKDTGLNTPITYTLITVWPTFLMLLILYYSLGILGTKKTVKPVQSLDPSFLYSLLFFQNISNKHLDTSGAKAIASLLLVNLSYLNVFQLLGDLMGQMHPELDVIYSKVKGCITKIQQHPNPMEVIQNSLKEHNLQLENFFGNIDKDGNIKIPVAAFWKAMMQVCL
ncbi:LOW QUALITY PROTEIN: leucine-rich repeat-containing protein 74A [Passerculus sandwichensis]